MRGAKYAEKPGGNIANASPEISEQDSGVFMPDQRYNIPQNVIDDIQPVDRIRLFEKMITPDYKREAGMNIGHESLNGGITPFTKELKISNLNDFQLWIVQEFTSMASALADHGAIEIAKQLLLERDILLSVAPSRGGAFIKLMNTEYQYKTIKGPDMKRRFFSREWETEQPPQ